MDLFVDQTLEDIVLSDGDILPVTDRANELVQRLFVRFKTFKREWFWNEQYGIDYLNDVFGVSKQKLTIDILMRDEISKESLVGSIVSFSSQISDYKYSCKFIVKLVEEETVVTLYFLVNENKVQLTDGNGNALFTYI